MPDRAGRWIADEPLKPIFPARHGDPFVIAYRDQRVVLRPVGAEPAVADTSVAW